MNRAREALIIALVTVISTVALWVPVGMQKIYENFDGPYYLVVAKSWYDKAIIGKTFSFPLLLEYYPSHFPIYPLLIKIATILPQVNLVRGMLIVNVMATIAAALVIYKINKSLWLALVWLFWWPRMWVVRSVGSPETLFVLGIVLSLYGFSKRKYWLAGIAGALAVLTKSPGILLFVTYGIWFIRKRDWHIWPVALIPLALVGLFYFYYLKTGDFWAYFHSGDNIHLQVLPFRVFDSSQPWVGEFWLEDVLWIYLIGAIGVIRAFKKSEIWGWFGTVFYASILFVSHRDISRYALPLVPVVLLGLSELLEKKEVRWVMALLVIPMYFYSLNFLLHNTVAIADWAPFFSK